MMYRSDVTPFANYAPDNFEDEIGYNELLNRYRQFFAAVGEHTESFTLTDRFLPAQRDPRYRYYILWNFFKYSPVRDSLVPIDNSYDYILDIIDIIIRDESTNAKIAMIVHYFIDNQLTDYMQMSLNAFYTISEVYKQIAVSIESITRTHSDLIKNIISQFLVFMLAIDDSKETLFEIYATES